MDGDNTVSKVLDCLRMYLVAVAFHKGIEASSSKSFVNYNGHKTRSDTVWHIWDGIVPSHCNLQRMLQTPPAEQGLHACKTQLKHVKKCTIWIVFSTEMHNSENWKNIAGINWSIRDEIWPRAPIGASARRSARRVEQPSQTYARTDISKAVYGDGRNT